MKLSEMVVYEDDDLLVINKPPGLVANRAESVKEKTVQDLMVEYRPEIFNDLEGGVEENEVFISRSGIAHRLDKDTSGVMVLGKSPRSLSIMMRRFADREVGKTYLALVHGQISPDRGDINLPIRRSSVNRHRFEVMVGGKSAVSYYDVQKKWGQKRIGKHVYQDGFCLVEMKPKTGRTHQIRVHLQHIRHPIVGDDLYGGRKRSRKDREWCPRQFLHAAKITFLHPTKEEKVKFEAPLSDDLQDALGKLEDE